MFVNPSVFSSLRLLPLLLLCAVVGGCTGEPDYPQSLVQADSAYLRGDYAQADSLLALYQANPSADEAVGKYAQLMALEQAFVHGQLSADHFSDVDSLCRYYDRRGTRESYSKALLFLGDVYEVAEDHPAALESYLKADELISGMDNAALQEWSCQRIGDVYFVQRMFDECKGYYRKYYNLAVNHNDERRTAIGSYYLGKVCTIESNVDSTIFYYKQAIKLSKNFDDMSSLASKSLSSLCDIYIQIEEYDSARAIMPRDEENEFNWAYWHYAQHHVDSAIVCFQKVLGKYNRNVDAEALKLLVELEKETGRQEAVLAYSERLLEAMDSLSIESQVEETRKVNAQHDYETIKQERDAIAEEGIHIRNRLLYTIAGLVLLLIIGFVTWKSYKAKSIAALEREKRLKYEEETRYRQSLQQLEENKQKLALLEQQLAEAKQQGNTETAQELTLYTEELLAQNQNIEAIQNRRELLDRRLRQVPICVRIQKHIHDNAFQLTEEEWELLGSHIDDIYDGFTARLFDMGALKPIELHVCYLLKLGLQPIDIAPIVGRSRSSISMMCGRINKKIHRSGAAQELADFVQSL